MSACFHTTSGVMLGLDYHVYWMLGPNGVPVPLPKHPHQATATFEILGQKHAVRLTADSDRMLREGFAVEHCVAHFPVPIPPMHPAAEGPWLAVIILTSKSGPAFSRSTVTNAGSPLACCVASSTGYSSNCGGIGAVTNMVSVVTTPSAGDIAAGVTKVGINAIVGGLFGGLTDLGPIIGHVAKWVFDHTLKKLLNPLIEWMSDEAEEVVDEFL